MFERLPSFLFAGPCARRAVCGAPEHEDCNQAGGGLPHSSTEGGFHGRPGGIWKLLRRVLLNEGPVHQTTASLKGITATPDGIPAAVVGTDPSQSLRDASEAVFEREAETPLRSPDRFTSESRTHAPIVLNGGVAFP